MFRIFRQSEPVSDFGLVTSKLYDQGGFYDAFSRDIRRASSLVVVESPFMTQYRVGKLLPDLRRLARKGVRVVINTKPVEEHDQNMAGQAAWAINALQDIGATVLLTGGHHRKLAVIDDVLWEGSLNILSQFDSCEVMRRIHSAELSEQMLAFTNLKKWL